MSSCLAERIRAARLLAIVTSSSGEVSLAILAGRSASTVAGTQISCTVPASSSRSSQSALAADCNVGGRRRRRLGAHRRGHRGDRVGVLAVPKGIERRGQLRHDGAGRHHVQIDEIIVLIAREVLIADIAAAGDGQRVVGDEQLVVHAVIDAANVARRGDEPGPGRESAAGKRIEHPDLDVRVFAQMQEAPVFARRIEIIDQDAHPHAAVRRQAHMMQQQPRGIVLLNDVVLDVERAFGMVGERDEIGQGLLARRQQADARQILVALLGRNEAAERRGLRDRAAPRCDISRHAAAGRRNRTAGARRSAMAGRTAARLDSTSPLRFTHRGMISGTLCAHADTASHSQLRPARRPHDARAGARTHGTVAVLRRGSGRGPVGLGGDFRAPRAALPGDRLRGRGSDREPGGASSAHRLPGHRGASSGRGPAAAARRGVEGAQLARHLSRRRRGAEGPDSGRLLR